MPGHLIGEAGEQLELSETAMRGLLYDVSASAERDDRPIHEPSPLSRQETASLRCLAAGKTYKQAALELGLSVSTVRSHLHRAYVKLEVVDRAQAVLPRRIAAGSETPRSESPVTTRVPAPPGEAGAPYCLPCSALRA